MPDGCVITVWCLFWVIAGGLHVLRPGTSVRWLLCTFTRENMWGKLVTAPLLRLCLHIWSLKVMHSDENTVTCTFPSVCTHSVFIWAKMSQERLSWRQAVQLLNSSPLSSVRSLHTWHTVSEPSSWEWLLLLIWDVSYWSPSAGLMSVTLCHCCAGVFITKGDVGVGTIVGSAVFNILCIIGVCGIFSLQVQYKGYTQHFCMFVSFFKLCFTSYLSSPPQTIHLTRWPLLRDSTYYTLSISALIVVRNQFIEPVQI